VLTITELVRKKYIFKEGRVLIYGRIDSIQKKFKFGE
jgi:hypothetical protein